MALVTGVHLVAIAFCQLIFFLLFGFDAHIMTSTTAAAAFDELIGGQVGCRNGI